MKATITTLFIMVLMMTIKAQQTFQTTFPFFEGEANGESLFAQSDGHIVAGIGQKDKFYLFLIKSNFEGDTIWTKDVDLGLTGLSSCTGTSDQNGNLYIAIEELLIKFDQFGNLLWSNAFSNNIRNLKFSDNIIWMSTRGVYLYKVNAETGDSLWRSNCFSEISSLPTSLTINSGNVLLTVSDKNSYSGWLYASELFYLQANSDSVINIPFNTGVNLVIVGTEYLNDEYYSFGHDVANSGNPIPKKYVVKYNTSGSILEVNEIELNYYMYGFHKMVITEDNQIVLMGSVFETVQSEEKVVLHCCTLAGDSIWTSINGMNESVIGFDLKLSSDGGYAISGSHQLVPYSIPYLLKTNSIGIITNIESPAYDNEHLLVYPNPVSETLNIHTSQYIGGTFTIYSFNSHMILERKLNSQDTKISVSQFPKGLYIYSINKSGKLFTGKFIVI